MKRLFAAILLFSLASTPSFAQFRSDLTQPDPPLNTASAMQGGNFFSQLFDPSRFNMHQSFSSTFISGGGQSMGLSMFTNTFAFHPMDDLYVSADVSAVYSPYNSLGSSFANSMNGLYLTNAQIDWKLSDNAFLKVQYLRRTWRRECTADIIHFTIRSTAIQPRRQQDFRRALRCKSINASRAGMCLTTRYSTDFLVPKASASASHSARCNCFRGRSLPSLELLW